MRAEELQRQVQSGQEAMDALAGITGQVIEECLQDIVVQILQTPGTEPQTLSLLKQSYDTLTTFRNKLVGYSEMGREANDILNGKEEQKIGRIV